MKAARAAKALPISVPIDRPTVSVDWNGREYVVAFERRMANSRIWRTDDADAVVRRLVLLQGVHDAYIALSDSAGHLAFPFRKAGGIYPRVRS